MRTPSPSLARPLSFERLAVLSLLVSVAGVAPATAQRRPLRTEPAVNEPSGTLVLETGMAVIADEPNYLTGALRHRWDGPLLRLLYAPAGNVQLDLEWRVAVGVWGEAGRGDIQSADWGDVTLRAKWRFLEGQGGHPTLACQFGVILPETSYEDKQFRPLGLGPNTLRTFAEVLLSQPLGPVRLDANAGLFLYDEVFRAHDQRDFLSYGLALVWHVSCGLDVVGEVAGRAGDGMPGADQTSEARAGIRVGSGSVRGDVAVRRGFLRADGTWGVTAGLSWTFHRGREAKTPAPRPPRRDGV
jgi:hypothetical protein